MQSRTLLFLFLVPLLLAACKKYEDGPYVSFYARKKRVVNEWEIEEATADDGSDRTDNYDGEVWKFSDDHEYFWRGDTSNSSIEGSWHFYDDQEGIELSGNVFLPHKGEYEILRLKKASLWLERDSDGEEIHLTPH